MQIQSIRLKNIKSYGEGADGNGITVSFQPGVNRVAGRNGHGKTTLIEALGYALFFCEPEHDENFKLQTYFLRSGEKEAEIDVVFTHGGETFRVERALGQSKRRSKVVQLSDGSTCAEMDEAVAAWMCHTLGGETRKVQPKQLSDLFSNLLGVKQGRLTWPFDSKPAAAREFFEPLLDVEVFRDSESRLRDTMRRFEASLSEQAMRLVEIRTKIDHLAGSKDNVPMKEAEVEARRNAAEKSRKQKDEAEKLKQLCEQKQTAFNAAKGAVEQAISHTKLAVQKREHDERQAVEAQVAGVAVQRADAGYRAYLKADEQLKVLLAQQMERATLGTRREETARARTQWETKRDAAQRQNAELGRQRDEKIQQIEGLKQNVAETVKAAEQTKIECEQLSQAVTAVKRSQDDLNGWLHDLSDRNGAAEMASDERVSGWEIQAVIKARAEQQRLTETARQWERTVNNAENTSQTLATQLAQIADGACPFLKTKCLQFDPKAVQSDLSKQEKEIENAGKQLRQANEAQKRAGLALTEETARLRRLAEAKVEHARKQGQARNGDLIRLEQNSDNEKRNLRQAELALTDLLAKIAQAEKEFLQADQETKTAVKRVVELEVALLKFANLDQAIRGQGSLKDANGRDHQLYLQNHTLAAKLDALQASLKISREAEARANEDVRQKTERFEQAGREFDPEVLRKAQDSAADARSRLALEERNLEIVRSELKKEKECLGQWKEACAERDKVENETARLRAAADLSKAAAKVLKDAAPSVAQHLCCRIASNAQRIFNQINQEPIEIDWKAEPHYGLRIIPGDRRFAMLSGGEQTKLALAMTLAMIQEFSGLHFAVFDEPTYAVDGDSRQRLADAIIEAQKAAGLEQVIVVSHDDAFEGKIEHVILLDKHAGMGTQLVELSAAL